MQIDITLGFYKILKRGENKILYVENYLLKKINCEGAIHITLLDPDKIQAHQAAQIAKTLEEAGTSAIMIGGSTIVSQSQLDKVILELNKEVNVPIILFPNNVTGISQYADAIWFMSLLNSDNPLFITGIQAQGALLVKRYKLEVLPLGYIIVDSGSSAAYMGRARALPRDKPEIAAAYALAAQYLGMRFVYLEAGSGARESISVEMIRVVKKTIDIPLIVGGGIRTKSTCKALVKAGANIIVTGTIVEEAGLKREVAEIIRAVRK